MPGQTLELGVRANLARAAKADELRHQLPNYNGLHYDMIAIRAAAMATMHTQTALVPLVAESTGDDPPLLQVRGSDEVQMVELAQVPPALHEPPDLMGLTIALNCCFTASWQPAHAVFKHESMSSITSQVLLPDALETAAK